jgi:5-methylthioadenosine/S-adenosylhomocysteine deaminase
MRSASRIFVAVVILSGFVAACTANTRDMLIEGATVVTMDDQHTVVPHGRVLIRNGAIVAVWSGPNPPAGVSVRNPIVITANPQDLLFPGLINLHSHPGFNILPAWLPPSSHAFAGKAGTDPYANRYQWKNAATTSPPEYQRLVSNPADVLTACLGLYGKMVKYAEVSALLGGETAIQGADSSDQESGRVLVRNIENRPFGAASRIAGRVPNIDLLSETPLLDEMTKGRYDAWLVHLAEGVRDADRRPGDQTSSREEFTTLKTKKLLSDITVVIHGTALERPDFAEMRAAQPVSGAGDGRGAKLVWSPLSNLLLYGATTHVYDALAENVLVSLGTDWTPSGSRTLLRELKIADAVLRDAHGLASARNQVPDLATDEALDRALVDMVTRNPALTLRWYDKVGSIEAHKIADLVLLRRPTPGPAKSVYRALIDATERDVGLVMVGGEPLAGDKDLMSMLKPGDFEIVSSAAETYEKAVDVTSNASAVGAGDTLAKLSATLRDALTALGGDNPPRGGGPGSPTNTHSYLRSHATCAGTDPTEAKLRSALITTAKVELLDGLSLNLEAIQLPPLLQADDDFLGHIMHADINPSTGLIADSTPPYHLYPANLNHLTPFGNPLATLP